MIRKTIIVFELISILLAIAVANLGVTIVPAYAKAQNTVELTDQQVEDIISRSYQYVAMFSVIQKFALDKSAGGMNGIGFNTPVAQTALLDHTMKSISRPNNDSLYQTVVLDLRNEPVIIEYPAIDSKFVALEGSSYSHYVDMPLLTSKGDFKTPTKVLFYTDRTKDYQGGKIDGIDRTIKVDGDFYVAFLRAMPQQANPARMKKIIEALQSVKVQTLSEFQGKPAKVYQSPNFPAYGKTDADVFANNLLEVMQFVFNHTTFDPSNPMDQAVLDAYEPLGVVPGQTFDSSKVAQLDGAQFRRIANKVNKEALADMGDRAKAAVIQPKMFMPKGQIDLETQVIQSVVGPIGVPSYVALYIPAGTKNGQPMNAKYDYVLKMSKDELPPANAFWSLTLYDLENGFFIPNDRKKYSVGENAGYKLNDDGDIEIYVSVNKPEGVPDENWLPIKREDIDLDAMFRIYEPDSKKMKTWEVPEFEMMGASK